MKKKSGFTILELAVTVIIIAVIAVVALPMYKHAILKSRFSTVMPMAKAVADAQEVYYLGNNQYALGKEDLDIAPVEAENTQVSLSPAEEDEEYIYVAAHRTDIPNVRYIMYQKNSPKFASNIHCEADANDEDALWLCEKALHGTEVTGSLQGKQYKTFLLAGDLGGSSFKVCPENAVCNEEGNVTGCESGYYQEEQTCKQEKACDESKKTIRTSCAEDCGEEIKEGACNVKTGQWENYTVTQACPTKPPLTKACSAIDSKWTSGTAQGTTQCSGNSWAEPSWNTEACEIACKEEEKQPTKDCACGKQTAGSVTCDTQTGKWIYDNWSACPVKPSEEENCDNGVSGKMTRSVTCKADNSGWEDPQWNKSQCCNPNSKPTNTRSCKDNYNANTCGLEKQQYTCSTNGTWEPSNTWDHTACQPAPSSKTVACDSPYTLGNKSSYYTCTSNEWKENWNYGSCGYACDNSNTDHWEKDYSCECGYKDVHFYCDTSSGTWTSYTYSCPTKPTPSTIETGRGKASECDSGYGYYAKEVYCDGTSWKQRNNYVAYCTDTEEEACNKISGCWWAQYQIPASGGTGGSTGYACACQSDMEW